MSPSPAQAKTEIIMGSIVSVTPVWAVALQDVSIIAGCVASVCGMLIGIHGVWRIWRHHRRDR